MELTKEYFDKGISNVLEKITEKIGDSEASIRADMATKDDLKAQSNDLKQYVHQAFETHQVWTGEHFKELIVAFDARDRVIKLEKDVAHLKLGRPRHA